MYCIVLSANELICQCDYYPPLLVKSKGLHPHLFSTVLGSVVAVVVVVVTSALCLHFTSIELCKAIQLSLLYSAQITRVCSSVRPFVYF